MIALTLGCLVDMSFARVSLLSERAHVIGCQRLEVVSDSSWVWLSFVRKSLNRDEL